MTGGDKDATLVIAYVTWVVTFTLLSAGNIRTVAATYLKRGL